MGAGLPRDTWRRVTCAGPGMRQRTSQAPCTTGSSTSRGRVSGSGNAGELLNQAGRCVEREDLALALVACQVRDAHALE